MKIYLAGPMKGIEHFNYPVFKSVREDLRSRGYIVRCPAEHDLEVGFDETTDHWDDESRLAAECFQWDIAAVLWSDAVIVLPGWQESAGAMLETQVAAATGTPVLVWPDFSVVQWNKRPEGAPVLPRRVPVLMQLDKGTDDRPGAHVVEVISCPDPARHAGCAACAAGKHDWYGVDGRCSCCNENLK